MFLSVGEYVTPDNLVYSQQIQVANSVVDTGRFDGVDVIIALPRLAVLKRARTHKKNIHQVLSMSRVPVHVFQSWVHSGLWLSFMLKKQALEGLASEIVSQLIWSPGDRVIIHARSYYAAQLALLLKEKCPESDIKVVFDMRSLWVPEFPLNSSLVGTAMVGFLRRWEHHLITRSDLTLITTLAGLNYLSLEGGYVNLQHIPLMGFAQSKILAERDFEAIVRRRWENKKVAYVGAISRWHPLSNVLLVMESLQKRMPIQAIAAVNHAAVIPGISVENHPHNEMVTFYSELLASIVPGMASTDDSFELLQMRINLFSTKAVESLSLGVPIIVTSQLAELSSFVKDHQCGIILGRGKNSIYETEFPSGFDFNSFDSWLQLSKNALKAGQLFSRENVVKTYLRYWESL